MQDELGLNYPQFDIQILGVNKLYSQSGNASISLGRDIPWLQDVDDDLDGLSDVWTDWNVTWRDVVILDGNNAKVASFNLTTYNLDNSNNYDALQQMFVDAASASIPEPSSLILLCTGAAGLLGVARRRRRRKRKG